jgi:hypothetical protein
MSEVTDLLALLKLTADGWRGGLAVTPRPTRRNAVLNQEDVDRMRSLFCTEYDRCLASAVRKGWASWTCEHCELFVLPGHLYAAELAERAMLRPPLEDPGAFGALVEDPA